MKTNFMWRSCLFLIVVGAMIQLTVARAFSVSSTSGICGVATGMLDKNQVETLFLLFLPLLQPNMRTHKTLGSDENILFREIL